MCTDMLMLLIFFSLLILKTFDKHGGRGQTLPNHIQSPALPEIGLRKLHFGRNNRIVKSKIKTKMLAASAQKMSCSSSSKCFRN